MAEGSHSCAACLQVQHKVAEAAQNEAQTVTCQAGLFETAVPVRAGKKLIAYLCTAQAFRKVPTNSQFAGVAKLAIKWGVKADHKTLRAAYFNSPIISAKEHHAVVALLTIFAQHLALLSNQIILQERNTELPVITQAKEFIRLHQTEPISLARVAASVNTSPCYFCKLFRKSTGITFTDYMSRTRVEHAKNLLLNPSLRVSEIGYHVGFESLSNFCRMFRKIVGQSPKEYRSQLPGPALVRKHRIVVAIPVFRSTAIVTDYRETALPPSLVDALEHAASHRFDETTLNPSAR